MNNLDIVRQKLIKPSSYLFLPKAFKDIPMPFADMEKQTYDEATDTWNGTGSYYTPNEVSSLLGNLLNLTDVVNGDFFLMRYGIDFDTYAALVTMLKANTLIDIRDNLDGTLKNVSEIDFETLVGNEFMIVPLHMASDIPKSVYIAPVEEPIPVEVI